MLEYDSGHGYPKTHREGMARFFSRWLKGEDRMIVEGDFPIEKDRDLQCTRTGQVLEDLKGKSVFDLNAQLAAELAKLRAGMKWEKEEFRKEVAKAIGLPEQIASAESMRTEIQRLADYELRLAAFTTGAGPLLPAATFRPVAEPRAVETVIYVTDRGKGSNPEAIRALVKSGKRVVAVDLRGFGETSPGTVKEGRPSTFGVEYKEAFIGMHLNRPLLGQRVLDLLSVVGAAAPKGGGIEVFGVGSAAPVVLHAAALDNRIKAVTIESGLISWDDVVRTPISTNQLGNTVPGALAVYDLPDLAAAIAPRPLTIRKPVDAAGQPADRGAVEEAYKPVRAAYEKAGTADKLVLE
jgi:pimeloyl-ACP methyl ester carboxylesterase